MRLMKSRAATRFAPTPWTPAKSVWAGTVNSLRRFRWGPRSAKAAVQRKLELALSTEFSAVKSGSAVFLYEIDLAALTAESRQALEQAMRGDLSSLHAASLPGISCVHSVWE